MNRQEYADEMKKREDERFAKHVIAERSTGSFGEDRWILRGSARGLEYPMEVSLYLGLHPDHRPFGVLVSGDYPGHLIVGHEGRDVKQLLDWVGNAQPDYVAEKVRLGETTDFDAEVAEGDLLGRVEDMRADPKKPTLLQKATCLHLEIAIQMLREGGTRLDLEGHLREDLGPLSYEEIRKLGEVVHHGLFVTQAVCRKLLFLLVGEVKKERGRP